ncbi:MAG: hypothetical protein HQL93_11425, partial [Magnetococcales bacterium]|nr:hypothetical protein [Magnetococcales bacterium]
MTDIVITDSDSPIVTATLTLSSSEAGTLSTATSGSVSSTFNGTVWWVTGPIADVNALLAGVSFTPQANWSQNFTITTEVIDSNASSTLYDISNWDQANWDHTANTLSGVKNATVNLPPVINGVPANVVAENTSYSFTPSATDQDSANLTFSIQNKPSWATFNATTGTLNGTPGFSDSGNYTNIIISVTDGLATVTLPTFSIVVTDVNTLPWISDIPNQSGQEDGVIGEINFTVGDLDTPASNLIVTATSSNIDLIPTDSSYLILGGSDTNRTLTIKPAANKHGTAQITISVSDGTFSVNNTFSVEVAPVNDPPTSDGTPPIQATPGVVQGGILTVNNTLADVDGLGTISYKWQVSVDGFTNWTDIAGATANTFTLTQNEVGKYIRSVASYTDGQGTAESVTSSATSAVTNLNDPPTGSVTITGTATQGQTLTATNTLADLDGMGTIGYQWKADGIAISGATNSTLILAESQVGKAITVVASYIDGQGTTESMTSTATGSIANVNDPPTGNVTITGTATQGHTLVAANTLADLDGMGPVTYQWKADNNAISGATGNTLVLTGAHVNKTITVVAIYIDAHGIQESITSTSTGAVANVNDPPTGSVTITGTAVKGQAIAANTLDLSDPDGLGVLSYQWKANGINISGATGETYLLTTSEVGAVITVEVRYTDGHGTTESVTSSPTGAVVNVNSSPTGSVTITGTATQGETLTAANTLADLDGMGTVSYQWKAGGVSIGGATNSSFVLTEAQVGKTLSVVASYTDGFGVHESVTSVATGVVVNLNDPPTGSVTINGSASQGQTLNAINTLADVDGLGTISYQWKADGSVITGATNTIFVVTEAQVGKVITVVASYTDTHGTAESVTSAATGVVSNMNDPPTGSVTITGTATQGESLTAANTLADLDGMGTLSYQWKADNNAISGATGTILVLTEAQVGKTITVVASFTDGHGTAESVTSSATSAVTNLNDPPTGSVTITGTATQGQTLTAANTIADLDGMGTISYQWKADGVAINGATSNILVLAESLVGKIITVVASFTDGHGTVESLTSVATSAVTNVNDSPTGNVTITGTATQGQTLTATNTLGDTDGLGIIGYQWKMDGNAITGATGDTFVLTEAQVGKIITVVASYTDGHGTIENRISPTTGIVTNINDSPTGSVTITGLAAQGQTLTATNTLADLDGLGTISLQWKANGNAISGATGGTLVLTEAQVGKTITVTANYTDGHGTVE